MWGRGVKKRCKVAFLANWSKEAWGRNMRDGFSGKRGKMLVYFGGGRRAKRRKFLQRLTAETIPRGKGKGKGEHQSKNQASLKKRLSNLIQPGKEKRDGRHDGSR